MDSYTLRKKYGGISVVVSACNSVKVKVSDRNRYITQNVSVVLMVKLSAVNREDVSSNLTGHARYGTILGFLST